ncbi:MAG: hypothetical protein HY619_03655 [Thaumarchaeota archaeon]|nr:hypothetical protein [Nitrososphaerota archaeon]
MPSTGRSQKIKAPFFIEVKDLKDLARLACAFERAPLPIFAFEVEGDLRLCVQLDIFMGRPIFYYVKGQHSQHFLGYRNISGTEDVVLTDSASNPVYMYSPIIAIKKSPRVFEKGSQRKEANTKKVLCSEVQNLASLAKVCSYKTIFEEPPIPLFFFDEDGKHVLGAFTRIDDYEEASIFFYMLLNESPSSQFLRFSSSNVTSTGFTGRIDEHGYVFIKIIRLVQEHPLVEIG